MFQYFFYNMVENTYLLVYTSLCKICLKIINVNGEPMQTASKASCAPVDQLLSEK